MDITSIMNCFNFYLIKKYKESVIMSTATINLENMNVEDLNSNETLRNSVIDNFTASDREFMEYFNELMEEAGLKFEFIPGINLTTAAHVSEVLGNKNSKGVRDQINKNSTEIELHGARQLKSAEIQELLREGTPGVDNSGCQLLKSPNGIVTVLLKNGTEFKLALSQSWYLTPESVLDLCMFMTGTEKAVAVRSAIINKLKEGQKSQSIVNKVRHSLANTILDLDMAFDKFALNKLVKDAFDTTSYRDKLRAKRLLSSVVKQLAERFNKAQIDYANRNIDSDEYECITTRVNMRSQACLELIVKLSDELEDARKETEEELSECNFSSGNVTLSMTDALNIWYNNNFAEDEEIPNKFRASSFYKKLETLNILTKPDSKFNRKLTDEYKFIKNSFILPETLAAFNCRVNKYGYAFVDIILSIYYGKLVLPNKLYTSETYSVENAEKFIKALINLDSNELKEEITALIITRVQNNCYANL